MRLKGATRAATQAISSSSSSSPRATTTATGHLAAVRVGTRDDGRVGDARVREEQRLELGGRHLLGTDLDELLEPVDDEDIARGVDAAEVAAAQPAAGAEDLGGRRGPAAVAAS